VALKSDPLDFDSFFNVARPVVVQEDNKIGIAIREFGCTQLC
jgi:hypothetical protein